MKMRKLFAGIAAAATMLGGLALGATANAATDDATITLTGATVKGHTYTAYKIASYVADNATVESGKLTGIVLDTVSEWETDAEAAVNSVAADTTTTDAYKQYSDPVAYAAAKYGSKGTQLGAFAQYLAGKTVGKTAAKSETVTADSAEVKFENLDEGLYLVTDSNGFPLTIVGTKVTVAGMEYEALGTTTLGSAVVKPDTTTQGKTASDNTLSVGDTVTYTLTAAIPDPVVDSYTLKFIDQPGPGQNVDLSSIKVKATKTGEQDKTLTETDADGFVVTTSDGSTVSEDGNTFTADGIHTFTVALKDAPALAGWTITVTYDATITNAAPTVIDKEYHEVYNKLVDNNGDVIPGTDVTVKYYDFAFTKVNKSDEGISGAKFAIKQSGDNGKYLAFDNGAWKTLDTKPADTATGEANGVFTSDTDGNVNVSGLKAGTYIVEEIKVADDYADYKPSFSVTLTDGKDNVFVDVNDTWDLFDPTTAKVTNVKNVTELPLTGAAGTALFSVIGLLLAGAAVTVFAKSRSTKRQLA